MMKFQKPKTDRCRQLREKLIRYGIRKNNF